MIVDLHAHMAMHLVPKEDPGTLTAMTQHDRADRRRDAGRARFVNWISRKHNYPGSGDPGVELGLMRKGGVGLACSVLYLPFAEIDLPLHWHGQPPRDDYFQQLLDQMQLVKDHVDEDDGARLVRGADDLPPDGGDGTVRIVHAVEGGVHLGERIKSIQDNAATLGERGVAYVTLAHLFDRQVATNAPALPFMPDLVYRVVFFEAPWRGLSERGRAALEALVGARVLIDVTHMSTRSLRDTFKALDDLDPQRRVPVIASHMACRFGRMAYNLKDNWIRKIAERGGVLGVILCEHYASSGLRKKPTTSQEQAIDVVCEHVERINRVTGSTDHAALGTDLDGFIKPTLNGLGTMEDLAALRDGLISRFDAEVAEKVCSGNALRVFRDYRFSR